MKTLRLIVLVLLAMLLPLRGVSAAALLCDQPPASRTEMHVVATHDHTGQDHSHSDSDRTRHCLSSCSAVPLLAAVPTVLAPALAGTIVFPDFAARAPTFQSEGPDRPPRGI